MNLPIRVYVGLGSNLGNVRCHLEDAIAALNALPHCHIVTHAGFYRTVPHGVSHRQPTFLNTVACLETTLSADDLFAALRRIERAHHRTRPHKNAPRTLDIDLLLYGARISHSRRITLPHPRMHLRPFVLVPLLEIAPHLHIPGKGCIRTLLTQHKATRQPPAFVR